MHALIGVFHMDPALREPQRQELHERIVPLVSHQPGFVSAVWSHDPGTNRSFSCVVLETEAAARKLAELVRQQSAERNEVGVVLESMVVTEVWADARRSAQEVRSC
jgi:hypothetical protein